VARCWADQWICELSNIKEATLWSNWAAVFLLQVEVKERNGWEESID
jgi:hypothetical protein